MEYMVSLGHAAPIGTEARTNGALHTSGRRIFSTSEVGSSDAARWAMDAGVIRRSLVILLVLSLSTVTSVPTAEAARSGNLLPGGHRTAASPVIIDEDVLRFRGHATASNVEQSVTEIRLVQELRGQLHFGDWNGDGVATPGTFRDGRWMLHNQLDAGDTAASFWFGRTGDVPLVGDWNGDGRDTIAVRRGDRFFLSSMNTSTAYDFPFGRASDVPLIGDWNGDGRDTVGVRRSATFYLTNQPRGGSAEIASTFGRASDLPLIGDWNGNGRDSVGIRRGASYFLSNDNRTTAVEFGFGGTSDSVLVWPGARPDRGCPTAAITRASTHGSVHGQVRAPSLGAARAGDPYLDRALQTANRHLLNARWQQEWQDRPKVSGYYDVIGTRPRGLEHAVRPPAMAAATLAISLRTGYEPAQTGQSRAFATSHARELIRSVACQHKATTVGGWGDHWQSAYWAQFAGLAAWLIWEDLNADERFYVTRMVVHEADRLVNRPVSYWRDAEGKGPRNTYAEVLAWDSSLSSLAAAMMPDHAQRHAWQQASVRLSVAAASMPHDLEDTDVLNGRPVNEWVDGYNIMPAGLVYNHNRISPDYSTAMHTMWSGGLFHTLAGQKTPRALFHNGEHIYGALSTHQFDQGTVYAPRSYAIRYPEGSSWSTIQQAQFVNFDAMAHTFGLDGSSPVSGHEWQRLHTIGQLHLQARHADGRTYRDATEHLYPGREELTGQLLAFARLSEQVGAHGRFELDDGVYGTPTPVVPADPLPDDEEGEDPETDVGDDPPVGDDPDPGDDVAPGDEPDPDVDSEDEQLPDGEDEPHPEPEPEPFPTAPAPFEWRQVALPLAGDVHRDGRADLGWWHRGEWALTTMDRRTYRFFYGRADDEPLLGDWNGDGRATVGIRRGNAYYLSNRVTGGPADYSFKYGRAGDVVLIGDWNGDGRDTIGLRRGATFYLSNAPRGGVADETFTYGRVSDSPLAGDWNGNGRDTVGIRRDNAYYLTNALRGGPADYSFLYGWGEDLSIIGDFNGNGRDTVSIVRSTTFHVNDHPRGGPATRSIDPPRPE